MPEIVIQGSFRSPTIEADSIEVQIPALCACLWVCRRFPEAEKSIWQHGENREQSYSWKWNELNIATRVDDLQTSDGTILCGEISDWMRATAAHSHPTAAPEESGKETA